MKYKFEFLIKHKSCFSFILLKKVKDKHKKYIQQIKVNSEKLSISQHIKLIKLNVPTTK